MNRELDIEIAKHLGYHVIDFVNGEGDDAFSLISPNGELADEAFGRSFHSTQFDKDLVWAVYTPAFSQSRYTLYIASGWVTDEGLLLKIYEEMDKLQIQNGSE